ncbi:MAG: hypothetical protein IT430_09620 [Phycisphaerales bacterium]|nr:hypothetical protein [Phycisphaerales bacterium]
MLTRRTLTIRALLSAVIAGSLLAAAGPRPAGRQSRPMTPFVTWSGAFSQVRQPAIERAVSREQWAALWKRHVGRNGERNATNVLVIPEIDFDSCMVVAVFGGEMTQCNGSRIVRIDEFDDHLLLRYERLDFEVSVRNGADARLVDVTPYGIFVLPRSHKRIVVEEAVPSMFGRPADARAVGEIPAF